MIRVGILGCAAIAKRSLAPAFAAHADFTITVIASRTPEKAAEFASQYRARACSYEELVSADDVDLVYCPLPTGLHAEWVKKCLLAGKHVLCEKSLGVSLAEVSELVEAARSRRLFLMESFQFRFHPQNLYVRRLLDEKKIGEIRQCVVRFGIPPFPEGKTNIRYSKSLGGGALLDNGAYTVKATTFLFGYDFDVVTATATVPDGEEVDIWGTMTLRSSSGIVSQAAYGFDHSYQCGYEIWGTKGTIKTTRAFTARPGFAAEVFIQTKDGTSVEKFDADHFALLLDYVSSCIASGKFENEYREALLQARLLQTAREKMS